MIRIIRKQPCRGSALTHEPSGQLEDEEWRSRQVSGGRGVTVTRGEQDPHQACLAPKAVPGDPESGLSK